MQVMKNTMASEIIADLIKNMNTVNDGMEHLCDEIRTIKAMFCAVRYAISEGAVEDEAACLDGVYHMLDNLYDNAQNLYGMSDKMIEEVM